MAYSRTRPAGSALCIFNQDCRVLARQPRSFSLLEPQRKRTKRNDSLAGGMTVRLVGSSIKFQLFVYGASSLQQAGYYGTTMIRVYCFSKDTSDSKAAVLKTISHNQNQGFFSAIDYVRAPCNGPGFLCSTILNTQNPCDRDAHRKVKAVFCILFDGA